MGDGAYIIGVESSEQSFRIDRNSLFYLHKQLVLCFVVICCVVLCCVVCVCVVLHCVVLCCVVLSCVVVCCVNWKTHMAFHLRFQFTIYAERFY